MLLPAARAARALCVGAAVRLGCSAARQPAQQMCAAAHSASLQVEQFGCLRDNYGFLLHDPVSESTAAVDTPEAEPILVALERRGWRLTHILNTHHHHDHAGQNLALKERTGCTIVGPAGEADRIPGIDKCVSGGDSFKLGSIDVQVLDVGGHTRGHIAFYVEKARAAFVGDSLFALGCGRLFEGTPEQAWASLQRLSALPPDTLVYCAHEYTEANLRFALSVDPSNDALQERATEIHKLREAGQYTVPTSIGLELATNPFLRPGSAKLREHIGVRPEEADVRVFARLRRMKDNF